MSQPTLEELAKQGDSNAMVASRTAEGIASLLNRAFEPKGVTAKAAIKNDSLNIIVEAADISY
jgi:phosphoribosyl-ATP pyrophosphohydrolase